MELLKCRVRKGKVLAHGCVDFTEGMAVELPQHVAFEVRHLVDIDTPTGPKPFEEAVGAVASWQEEAAKSLPHERGSILQQHRARLLEQLKDINDALEALTPRAATKKGKNGNGNVKPAGAADAAAAEGQ